MNGTHVLSIARLKGLTYSWRKASEILSSQVFVVLQRATRRVPVFLFSPLGITIAFIQLLLFPNRARAHQRNIKRALADNTPGMIRRWSLTLKALANYGYFLLEYFKAHSLPGNRLLDSFRFQGLEEVDRALGRGRGVILVAVHLGNWWAGATALALAGYRLHIVTGVQFTEALSRHAKAANESSGLCTVSPGPGQYRSLITALRNNDLIALPVDGDIFERGLEVPFFSGVVRAPAGPARLAAITGAAVVACRVIRTEPLKFRFEFTTVWEGSAAREGSEKGDKWVSSARNVAPKPRQPIPTSGKPFVGSGESVPATREPVVRPREQVLSPRGAGFVKDLTAAIMNEQERAIRANLNQWCIFRDLWPNSGSSK